MMRARFVLLLAVLGPLAIGRAIDAQGPKPPKHLGEDGMSPMGRRAARSARARAAAYLREKGLIDLFNEEGTDESAGEPVDCDDNGCETGGEFDSPNGTQSELSIAIDASGSHVVIGFNDFRGFNSNPVSLSGFAYSDDGGATFVDGGQLPVTANGQLSNGTKLPQVAGDPD